jgi:hypothetical protein
MAKNSEEANFPRLTVGRGFTQSGIRLQNPKRGLALEPLVGFESTTHIGR